MVSGSGDTMLPGSMVLWHWHTSNHAAEQTLMFSCTIYQFPFRHAACTCLHHDMTTALSFPRSRNSLSSSFHARAHTHLRQTFCFRHGLPLPATLLPHLPPSCSLPQRRRREELPLYPINQSVALLETGRRKRRHLKGKRQEQDRQALCCFFLLQGACNLEKHKTGQAGAAFGGGRPGPGRQEQT